MQGNRGSFTEELVNKMNEIYLKKGLGLVTKIPTPTKVLATKKGMITRAFYEEKGILDYVGVIQGLPIAFDAKETKGKSLPLSNIADHQYSYIENFMEQKGYAFILVNFTDLQKIYLIPGEMVLQYKRESLQGGRKSIPEGALGERLEVDFKNLPNYLPTLISLSQEISL